MKLLRKMVTESSARMLVRTAFLMMIVSSISYGSGAGAQKAAPPPFNSGNRLFNRFQVQFKKDWILPLADPVKLIEIGPVTDGKKSNLVMLVTGQNPGDTQRTVRVMHWSAPRFLVDTEIVSQSLGIDSLLLGRFHAGKPTVLVDPTKTAATVPGKKAKPVKPKDLQVGRGLQVLTNAGVYVWADNNLMRLAAVPPDVKLSITQEGKRDMMLVGAGEGATPYEFQEEELRPASASVMSGDGYVRFGVGTQEFPGNEKMTLGSGIRYIQSIWVGNAKWMIGLERGKPALAADAPGATTGDRLVVYVPKYGSRDKSFWSSRSDDMEESWRSDPIPGRVLDVRVGDPHNDGKPGILVLTSENEGKIRVLTFYSVQGPN